MQYSIYELHKAVTEANIIIDIIIHSIEYYNKE